MLAIAPFLQTMVPTVARALEAAQEVLSHETKDHYTPGQHDAAPVNRQQMLALTRNSKTVSADIQKHDFKTLSTDMMTMTAPQRLATLADLRQNHPDDYKMLLSDVRSGKVENAFVKTAVGIDTLKSTPWAQSGEGAEVVEHLEKQYAKNFIVLRDQDKIGGLGSTDNLGDKTGRDGNAVDSVISISAQLADSPEGMAAILAHEGQHSKRAAKGEMKRTLAEETDANSLTAQLWTGFGSEKNNTVAKDQIKSLDTTATFYDPWDTGKMRTHIAIGYAGDAMDKKAWAAAGGVLSDYSNVGDFQSASDDDLAELFYKARDIAGQVKSPGAFKTSTEGLVDELKSRGFVPEWAN